MQKEWEKFAGSKGNVNISASLLMTDLSGAKKINDNPVNKKCLNRSALLCLNYS